MIYPLVPQLTNFRLQICIRGDNVFSRYYKDEKNTATSLDADGWFRTGDVGEIDSNGRFKIIDRVKVRALF